MPGGIQPPIQELLRWPAPNHVNPTTRSDYVIITACILTPISITLLCTRLYVRISMQRNAGVDDWFMLAALFPMIAMSVLCPFVSERIQFNRHVWDVEQDYFVKQRKFVLAIYCIFTLASGLVKMSVLLFYRRLSVRTVSPPFRWIMRIMIVLVGGYTIAFCAVLGFACRPITAFWDQVDIMKRFDPTYRYTCINEGADVVANGIVATVQDLIVAFLPTLLCWKLTLPIRQKVALYAIFAISYSIVALGALRTWTTWRIYFQTYDVTWHANDTFFFSMLELHVGAMCANAPSLKVFFKHVFASEKLSKLFSSRSSKSRSRGSRAQRSLDPSHSGGSKTSAWIPIGFWRSQHSHGTSGYLSEANTHVTTDEHGGIVKIGSHAQSRFYDGDYDTKSGEPEYMDTVLPCAGPHDLELGDMPSSRQEQTRTEIQALPQLPQPTTPNWLKPLSSRSPTPKW